MKSSGRKLCSVSVDLDPIACYYRIHGLGSHPLGLTDVVIRRAVPRLLESFSKRGIPATFFVVGADLESSGTRGQAMRSVIREVANLGHELGNHSYSHPYDLARLPSEAIAREITHAHELITEVGLKAPVGFRAPGYDFSQAMLAEISRLGYRYDSSIFPAPGYYAVKAAMMTALKIVGKRSAAVLTDPRALLAPTEPYRPHPRTPWRRGQSSIVELPISVTPWGRTPVIGTSLLVAPTRLRAHWLEAVRARPFFNLELHGIDLLDADIDGIPAEVALHQPDLRVSLVSKRRALEATLDRLALDYDFVSLRDAAAQVQREGRM